MAINLSPESVTLNPSPATFAARVPRALDDPRMLGFSMLLFLP